jgi:mannosyltransferase OCH1-like enzyme
MFWDEQALASNFPQGLRNQKQFDDMEELCGKCDIARVEILNRFGGFFIDADSICLNPLNDFFVRNDSFTCYENEFERGNLLACGYLASTPGNKLMQLLIEAIGKIDVAEILSTPGKSPFDTSRQAWRITGSELLTSLVFEKRYSAITIYPSYYFIPKHYTGRVYKGLGTTYGTQLWGSTLGSQFYGYRLDVVDFDFNHRP